MSESYEFPGGINSPIIRRPAQAYVGEFPDGEDVVKMETPDGDLVVTTTKGIYRIPAATMGWLGPHPIRNWEPFRVKP